MGNGLLTAYAGAGAAEGFGTAVNYERERPVRELRLQEARAQQERAALQLQKEKALTPAQTEKELAELRAQAYETNSKLLEQRTYDALRRYDVDGDIRHLNTFLSEAKASPSGSNIYGNIARLDTLQGTDKGELTKLFNAAGITDIEDVMRNKDLAKDFVVATDTSGQLSLYNLTMLKAGMRYDSYAMSDELSKAEMRKKMLDIVQGPQTAETQMIRDLAKVYEKEGIENPLEQAINTVKGAGKSDPSTAVERTAAKLREKNLGLDYAKSIEQAAELHSAKSKDEREARRLAERYGISYDEAFSQVTARTERTSTQKNADAAGEVRSNLDKLDKGGFFSLDLTKKENRRKAGPLVQQLEQLSGKSMSTEDIRTARNIRDLISLGGTAGSDLSGQETGLLDSLLSNAKKYITDEGGAKGVAAYETFRNIFRNSLYGASLTTGETSAFNAAAGTLGQKLGPVLEQLNMQMTSMRNQLSAIYDMNDEYVAYYYLGMDQEQLDKTIEAIDQRINMLKMRSTKSRATEKVKLPVRSAEEDMQILRELDAGN